MSFIEVSHQVVSGMKTYPGLPEPSVDVVFDYDASRERYQGKAEFLIASLHLCGNTGTYVDSPIHRYRGGADLAGGPPGGVAARERRAGGRLGPLAPLARPGRLGRRRIARALLEPKTPNCWIAKAFLDPGPCMASVLTSWVGVSK